MSGDAARVLVRRLERAVAVGRVGQYYRDHLLWRHFEIGTADTLASVRKRNGPAIRWRLQTVINVVHALECHRLPRIYFDNDFLRLLNPGLVVAERRTGYHAAVFKHCGNFDQRHIKLAQKTVFDELGHMAQVDVHVFHFAGIDALASLGIGLVGKSQMNAARHGERAVELRSGGSSGKDADLEFLAAQIGVGDAAR